LFVLLFHIALPWHSVKMITHIASPDSIFLLAIFWPQTVLASLFFFLLTNLPIGVKAPVDKCGSLTRQVGE
jgi:hypothetical protein